MTLSNSMIELIEKKSEMFGEFNTICSDFAKELLTDPAILAFVKGDEWVRVEDSKKFFHEFYDMAITVLCPIWNKVTKKWSWELYHAEICDDGELFFVDGSGSCGVDYTAVAYYRIESFPELPTTPPKTNQP